MSTARLALEDATIFTGRAFGACGNRVTSSGEVVFNTALTGYQEALTDPSYAGQILTMTASQIGNYGVCTDDVESDRPQVAGFIVRELSRVRSNHRSCAELSEWLDEAGVLGLEGIDTRALVRHLRELGAMRGVLSCDDTKSDQELVELARRSPEMLGLDLASCVSVQEPQTFSEDLGVWKGRAGEAAEGPSAHRRPLRVVALDCGGKRNIYRNLVGRGCSVTVLPLSTSAQEILAAEPDGLMVSNGPGDPAAVEAAVQTLRSVAGKVPTFGICLGHQLLALALGARTFKLKFGHRGANQPVRNLMTGKVEITSQNHGFCVDAGSLEAIDCEATHVHLNDGTLAGFRHRTLPIFSVQYHPEASPGPHDSQYLFDVFVEMMEARRPAVV